MKDLLIGVLVMGLLLFFVYIIASISNQNHNKECKKFGIEYEFRNGYNAKCVNIITGEAKYL